MRKFFTEKMDRFREFRATDTFQQTKTQFLTGFSVGGSLGALYTVLMCASPRFRGRRGRFLLYHLPKNISTSGLPFAGFLTVGALIRSH